MHIGLRGFLYRSVPIEIHR